MYSRTFHKERFSYFDTFVILAHLLLFPAVLNAQSNQVHLKSIDVTKLETGVIVVIQADGDITAYKSFTLEDPARIVFDLFGIKSPYKRERSIPVNSPLLKRIRHYGDPARLRVVLDTDTPYLKDHSFEVVKNRLKIGIGLDISQLAAKPSEKPKPSKQPSPPTKQAPKPAAKQPGLKISEATTRKTVEGPTSREPDPLAIMGDKLDFLQYKEPAERFTLKETIRAAIAANLELKISKEAVRAADATKKAKQTNFYPTFSADYRFRRNDERPTLGGFAEGSKNRFDFSTTVSQPIFTGFSILNQYQIARLGLEASKINERIKKQDIILEAKTAYFNLLKAQKLYAIAKQTVEQISAQREVARNFYEVGMSPLNDFLQAEVELANAKQDLIIARNSLETARSQFNILLRRPINAPIELEDVLTYDPFEYKLDWCQKTAERNRLEILLAEKEVEIAKREVELSKKDFFPSINLQGTYFRAGTDLDVSGGTGIFDPEGWYIGAEASWDFWEWGRTVYEKKEKISQLSQAQLRKENLLDQVRLQVKRAYLKNLENEANILTLQKAIRQAEENYRIFQERYKEQVTTSTDVLIAQTLLNRTQTNFYTALYDFKISKAALYRAMGLELLE
ncbi:MAG: TolC family protein [Deltaproteobacteria bacterium]|nr:TolC family protein [Deltaproteobacteria bacterium]MBW1993864.1 TolC family protein [Deltaproteobacteria bacterium]MBW2150148.1 TolC family protein [Deltaproteobacteria bacterium]